MNFRNLFFVLFVLLTLPLFSKGAIKVLDSSIKWIDSVILGRTVENLDNTNESLAIILPANESITVNRGTEVVKTEDIPTQKKVSLKGQTITVKRGTDSIIL